VKIQDSEVELGGETIRVSQLVLWVHSTEVTIHSIAGAGVQEPIEAKEVKI